MGNRYVPGGVLTVTYEASRFLNTNVKLKNKLDMNFKHIKTHEENTSELNISDVSSRKESLWGRMVKLINEHPDEDVRENADMLLTQYNTAGGRRIKHELEYMLQKCGY